jgi:TatD DNase family protein
VKLFDSHAHLAAPELLAEEAGVLRRAREAGLVGVVAVGAGYGADGQRGAVQLAERHPDVWATAGVHPHDASTWCEEAERSVDGWLDHERVVAVGECGLDYWYENSPREQQRECLRGHIRLARGRGLPLVIHARSSRDTRDALEEMLEIFDDEGAEQSGGVIHCFTGDQRFAEDCLARSFQLSFSGIVTYKNAAELREVALATPLERTMIETDSPLLVPAPYRGKQRRNEPAWVARVAECLAELHGLEPAIIAERTAECAARTFRIELAS